MKKRLNDEKIMSVSDLLFNISSFYINISNFPNKYTFFMDLKNLTLGTDKRRNCWGTTPDLFSKKTVC